jgi:hypothetical protein
MNPLLVTYNKQYNTKVGLRNLANLRIKFDCDILTQTVNPDVVKRITRGTLRRLGSLYWHCIAGQTVFPVQISSKMKIPLIIWGAHQGVDQVGMYSHLHEVEMTRRYRQEHDLMGVEAEDLVSEYDEITHDDVKAFIYPENRIIEAVGVRGIYLNNYFRWDSRVQHEKMIKLYGYESNYQTRTFDLYNDVDCWMYSDLHDYVKYIKHGFGKVVDHACRELRLGHISKEEGRSLISTYLSREPKNKEMFLSWIGMSESGLDFILDQHRNPTLWSRNSNWNWELRPDVRDWIEKFRSSSRKTRLKRSFVKTKSGVSTDHNKQFILVGRGFR